MTDDALVKEKTVRALTDRMIAAVNALEFDPAMVGQATDAALSALASAGSADAARDAATQAVADAEAIRDDTALIAGLTGEDGAVAYLVGNAGSDTQTALSKIAAKPALQAADATLRASINAVRLQPRFTLIDDDGHDSVLTVLADIMTTRNIPAGTAIIGRTSPIFVDPVKRAQLKALQDDHGWEVLSHTMDHTEIASMTRADYIASCEELLQVTHENGVDVRNIVYPYGLEGDNWDVTPRYFTGGFGTGSGVNTRGTTDGYGVRRQGLGSMMSPETQTLAQFKVLIDSTIANNQWLVFMTHIGSADATGVQLIKDVLDYTIAQGGKFISPRDGLREFGPVGQVGRIGKNSGYWHVASEGVVNSSRYFLDEKRETKLESDAFDEPGINRLRVKQFIAQGWSIGSGYVTEHGLTTGWDVQEFLTTAGLRYMRRWVASGTPAWDTWNEMVQGKPAFDYAMTERTIPAHSTVDVNVSSATSQTSMAYMATPTGQLETGLTWNVWCYGNGVVRIRLANVTPTAVVATARTWRIRPTRTVA